MSDIFISYSKQDQSEVRLLAAFLEAQGYSVWWDTSLLSGDNFRQIIMEELAKARAAIVIWTEDSVTSDWVMSEAGRAHADQKLIPVKARGLEYKDIPPPFDNQHTENLDAHENILAAVQVQMAKPPPPAPLWKKARFELLTWFGILGAAITLAANIRGVVQLAVWVRSLVDSWVAAVTWFWAKILFFLPKITSADALMFTFISFCIINMAASSFGVAHSIHGGLRKAKFVSMLAIILLVFSFGFLDIIRLHPRTYSVSGEIVFYFPLILNDYLHFDQFNYRGDVDMAIKILIILVIFALPFAAIFMIASIVVYFALRFAGFSMNIDSLNMRLWRIIIGVAFILAFNYASLWVEKQPWTKDLLAG